MDQKTGQQNGIIGLAILQVICRKNTRAGRLIRAKMNSRTEWWNVLPLMDGRLWFWPRKPPLPMRWQDMDFIIDTGIKDERKDTQNEDTCNTLFDRV